MTAAAMMDGETARAVENRDLRAARWLALLIPFGLLAGALGSEKFGGLVPCEMCHWQRWPHYFAVAVAAVALATRGHAISRPLVWLAALGIAVSGAIGVFHAGVELELWEGITTCTSTAAGASTEELLNSILNTPLVRCDQVQFAFLGISMAGWNAIISLTGAAIIAFLLRRGRA